MLRSGIELKFVDGGINRDDEGGDEVERTDDEDEDVVVKVDIELVTGRGDEVDFIFYLDIFYGFWSIKIDYIYINI